MNCLPKPSANCNMLTLANTYLHGFVPNGWSLDGVAYQKDLKGSYWSVNYSAIEAPDEDDQSIMTAKAKLQHLLANKATIHRFTYLFICVGGGSCPKWQVLISQ